MYSTVHASSALVISILSPYSWVVFLLSLIAHYLLDIIPHGDKKLARWISERFNRLFLVEAIDFFVLIILLIILNFTLGLPPIKLLIAGLIGALLPDVITVAFWIVKKVFAPGNAIYKLFFYHRKFHKALHILEKKEIPTLWGIVIQGGITAAFIWYYNFLVG